MFAGYASVDAECWIVDGGITVDKRMVAVMLQMLILVTLFPMMMVSSLRESGYG